MAPDPDSASRVSGFRKSASLGSLNGKLKWKSFQMATPYKVMATTVMMKASTDAMPGLALTEVIQNWMMVSDKKNRVRKYKQK